MKNIFTLIALCACTALFAQRKVAQQVADLEQQKAKFTQFSLLTASNETPGADVSKTVDKATMAKINMQSVNDIVANQYETIEVAIPYQGSTILAKLYKVNLFNENFHVDTNRETNIAYQKGVYYRGIVSGDYHSVASFSFFNNKFNAIVSSDLLGNLVIGKLEKPNNVLDYIVYSDANMKISNPFKCGFKDDESKHVEILENSNHRQALTERCVTMYFEIDHDLYLENGSSTTETTDWMTSVFNNVQTLYNNDEITVSLKSLYIWTDFDPYFGESSQEYLYMFNEQTPVFDGDVGQLIGIDEGGLGGVAVNIDGLCSQSNFSYSDVDFDFNTVPSYSWTVQVITHEFGHLLGSPHTHACVWNGDGTAIDNCAPVALGDDWEGGDCMTTPPTIPYAAKGTIMSYCHLLSGVGINFNNGFGDQPKALLISTINGATCLSTDCINTCINTVTDITYTNVTTTAATITWNDLSTTNTQWEVAVFPFTASTGPYTTVNTNSFTTTTPLNPNTYYKVRVRPVCTTGSIPGYRQSIMATAGAWCSGVVIADTGGVNNNYGNSQSYIRTLIPNEPSKKIRLDFSQFNLEIDYDFLNIYDGNNTSAPDLGGYTGDFIPTTFVSTAVDGSLTLAFFSDQGVVESGYAANVSCEQNLGTGNFTENIDFTYYPNPTNGFVNISSKTEITELSVYNITGQLLYHNKENTLDTRVDVSAFSTGTYFFKLKFGEKEANFKILKQ